MKSDGVIKPVEVTEIFDPPKAEKKGTADSLDAIFLFAVSVALLWFVGAPLQADNLFSGLVVTELAVVVLPTYILAKRLKLDFRETFRLKPILPGGAILMILLSVAGFVLITQLQVLITQLVEIPEYYIETSESMLTQFTGIGTIAGLAIIALLPAFCEEFLFRGYILDGLTRRWGATAGIVATGILFGAFHLDPFRFIAASLLGIIYGAIVWRHGSIFYGMIGHFMNNGLAFAVMLLNKNDFLEIALENTITRLIVTVLAAVVFIYCFRILWKMPSKTSREFTDA